MFHLLCSFGKRQSLRLLFSFAELGSAMVKVLDLFSGMGAFTKALKGTDHKIIHFCENEKNAAKAYSLIHNIDESRNLGDIRLVDEKALPEVNLITYGFPCTDIAHPGKMKGFYDENGKQTRSGLFFDAYRIISYLKPEIAIAENVKNLDSKRFEYEFDLVLHLLEKAGYNNYYKVLNSKDFGIPHRRERLFIVSLRRDIDNWEFTFPGKREMRPVKDFMIPDAEDKYYLGSENSKFTAAQSRMFTENGDVRRYIGSDKIDAFRENQFADISFPNGYGRGIRVSEICPALTVTTSKDLVYKDSRGIRKIRPKDCFRLLGFDDSDFDKVDKVISDAQLLRMAGNSIVVNVIKDILIQIEKSLNCDYFLWR